MMCPGLESSYFKYSGIGAVGNLESDSQADDTEWSMSQSDTGAGYIALLNLSRLFVAFLDS